MHPVGEVLGEGQRVYKAWQVRRQLIYDDLLLGLGESQFQIFQVLIPNVFIQQYWHIAQYFAQYWAGGL